MLNALPPVLLGPLALALYLANTVLWCLPIYALALARLLVPWPAWRELCIRWLNGLGEGWIRGTNALTDLLYRFDRDIEVAADLRRDRWYLVIANHQSWVDIIALLQTFRARIPFPKFFTKREILWVPLLGTAVWALEFPIMRRYTPEVLEKRPELRGRDLEATCRACDRLRRAPATIVNFLEGTRFTAEKQARQGSSYRHLLRPRAGGAALALTGMAGKIDILLDLTILYPEGVPTFWEFLCGRVRRLKVRLRPIAVPEEFRQGDYLNDPDFRRRFQEWIDGLWREKDALIERMRKEGPPQRF